MAGKFQRALLLGMAACATAGHSAQAETRFDVDTTNDTVDVAVGNGICADAAGTCSLRAAVQEANADTFGHATIVLSAGTYRLSRRGTGESASATGDLDIHTNLTVIGAGADLTIVDGDGADRLFDVPSVDDTASPTIRNLRLQGMTLTHGRRDGIPESDKEGAVLRAGIAVQTSMRDIVIRDNLGGQAANWSIIDNQGCLEGVRVRVLDNGENGFPAILTHGDHSCLLLEDSELAGNDLAILAKGGVMNLRRVLLRDNHGFAISLDERNVSFLENVTISGNGSALLNDGGANVHLANSTVVGNVSAGLLDVHALGSVLTGLTNTVVSGNGIGSNGAFFDCAGPVYSEGGGNLIGNSTNCQQFRTQPSDQLDVDADVGPLADHGGFTWSHLLGPNAIDHAVDEACPVTDQRGVLRPIDGDGDGVAHCDIGAVEHSADIVFLDGFDAS